MRNETVTELLKSSTDENAYEFLVGYFSGVSAINVDQQDIYNNIDGLGVMIYLPVDAAMKEFSTNGELNVKFWMTIHEVSHVFQEGGQVLVQKSILTQEQLEEVRKISECLDQSKISTSNSETIVSSFQTAATYYTSGDIRGVGQSLAQISLQLCSGEASFLLY